MITDRREIGNFIFREGVMHVSTRNFIFRTKEKQLCQRRSKEQKEALDTTSKLEKAEAQQTPPEMGCPLDWPNYLA